MDPSKALQAMTPTPSPFPTSAGPTPFEGWQFGVDVAATIATLVLAIAALVISSRAHRLNVELRKEAGVHAALTDRLKFAAELEVYRESLVEMAATPKETRKSVGKSYRYVATQAMNHGADFRRILQPWRVLEKEIEALTGPEQVATAKGIGSALARLNIYTSEWVNDPAVELPDPPISIHDPIRE